VNAWEAFTSVSADLTTSRILTVRQLDDDSGRYDWPNGEVHHGIAGWTIQCHGDDPAGAFVKCWGRTSEAVQDCLGRLCQFVTSGGTTALYPDTED